MPSLSYATKDGDTLDGIALQYYNDEYKAAVIADSNPRWAGMIVFPAGAVLSIPIIQDDSPSVLPPWKRG